MPKSLQEHVADLEAVMDRTFHHVASVLDYGPDERSQPDAKAHIEGRIEEFYEEWIETGDAVIDDAEIIELFRERAMIEYRILAISEEIPDDGETLQ
jgi:hypothetical protein